jgi:phosphoribosylanthranilate isomerase
LDSNNIYEALRMVEPYGIDVASGIEDSPGVKDPAKMRAIVTAVRDHYASR